jgi:NAD(P)-dependent dehydrogenase (short-subunit alcohol dehydrogenase family)
MSGKRVFVTGGASGLGLALAARYARAGWRVCVGDIQEAKGREAVAGLRAAGATAEFLRCDVTRDGDVEAAADWLDREWGGADLVFNNAGVAVSGPVEAVPLDDWRWIVEVNLLGVVRGCRAFAGRFKARRGGHVVNVASMAGLVHPPLMAPYNATKAAVVALSETLYAELAPHGVAVSVVCPSFFRTNLIDTARMTAPADRATAEKLIAGARRGASEIAEVVYRGVARRRFRILTETEGRTVWPLKRLLPFPLFARVLARLAPHPPTPPPGELSGIP